MNHFGLFFLNDNGQLALSTAGAGQPLSNFDVPSWQSDCSRCWPR
ncbi:hypothetical protein I552_3765 [Mycobacterium xenopi 3993]|nr:hypothetical protein I552_3765 [Mycobacterium xenopi 3993]